MRYMGIWVPALASLLLSPSVARSQDPPTDLAEVLRQPVLAGFLAVQTGFLLTWDEAIRGRDEESLERRLQTILELELRRNGIRIHDGPPTSLIPELRIEITTLAHTGIVAYSYDVELRETAMPVRRFYSLFAAAELAAMSSPAGAQYPAGPWKSDAWDRLTNTAPVGVWIPTWQGAGGVATVGRNNLQDSLESTVRELAQEFANEYLAANPQGG